MEILLKFMTMRKTFQQNHVSICLKLSATDSKNVESLLSPVNTIKGLTGQYREPGGPSSAFVTIIIFTLILFILLR